MELKERTKGRASDEQTLPYFSNQLWAADTVRLHSSGELSSQLSLIWSFKINPFESKILR